MVAVRIKKIRQSDLLNLVQVLLTRRRQWSEEMVDSFRLAVRNLCPISRRFAVNSMSLHHSDLAVCGSINPDVFALSLLARPLSCCRSAESTRAVLRGKRCLFRTTACSILGKKGGYLLKKSVWLFYQWVVTYVRVQF